MPSRPPVHGSQSRPRESKHYDQMRGTATQRGYNSKWTRYAKDFMRKHPLCVHCQALGRVTASTDVDHIEPHRLSEALESGDAQRIATARRKFWEPTNHQALCHPCHSRKTAAHDSGFGNRRSLSNPRILGDSTRAIPPGGG